MEKYCLLGKKLSHSMSPFIHNELFNLSKKEGVYELLELENLDNFNQIIEKYNSFNVTIPYKECVYKLCDSIDKSAIPYRAVNCVDKNRKGYNTDVDGFRKSVESIISSYDIKVLLLGFGGVGKMIAKQFNSEKLTIAIRNITDEKIKDIKSFLGNGVTIVDIEKNILGNFDLIVNATPIGMYPNVDFSPIPMSVVKNSKAVYDTIYNPYQTKLLEYAKECNIPYKCGLDMLVYQAVVSHEYWYCAKFSSEDIRVLIKKVKDYMENRK